MPDEILTSSYSQNIADVTHTGVARTMQIYDKKVKQDISDFITTIDPNKSPFMRFLEAIGTKEACSNFKYEWLEDDNKDFKTTIAGGSGVIASAVSTDLQTAASNLYQRDDILKIVYLTPGPNFGATEIVRVTAKTNATTYVVARSASGTTATANIASGDEVIKIGSNHAENSLQADPDFTTPAWYYNFVQTFKSAVAISGRFDNMDVRGTNNEINRQLQVRMRDHIESLENAMLFGERAQEGTRTYTGGLTWFIDNFAPSGNFYDAAADTFNERWLDRKSNDFFRYGSDRKVALVGGQILSKVGTFAKDYLRYNDKASVTLGMEVMDYMSSHGTISFIHSRTLDESSFYQKQMLLFDPKFIKKRYLQGRDTQIRMNVQEPGRDGKVHEIISDCGLEVRLPQAHFVINNLDNSIT